MAEDVKLLPCPFCGGQVFIHHGHRDIGYVTCGQRDDGSDGCGVVASFRPNKGGREAIAAWNRRATAAKDAEIEALRAEVASAQQMTEMVHMALRIAVANEAKAEARAERLAEALRLFLQAGVGNSTDFYVQHNATLAARAALEQEAGR